LRGLTEFPQVVNQLCVWAIENGALGTFIAMLARLDFELQSEIIGDLSQDIQKRLSDFDFDFLPFFERVSRATQVQILLTCRPAVFQSILQRFAKLVKKIGSSIVADFVTKNEWFRAMKFCEATNVDPCASLRLAKNLASVDIDECWTTLSRDRELWNDEPAVLKMLSFCFIVSDLGNWAVASLAIAKDAPKARFLVAGDDALRQTLSSYVAERPESQVAPFLRDVLEVD
jgi:hypothetical protein